MKKICLGAESAALVTDYLTRKYLSGVDVSEGYLVSTKNTQTYFTDARYFYAAKPMVEKEGYTALLYRDFLNIKDYLTSLGITKLYVDYSRVTVKEFKVYSEWFEMHDLSVELDKMRAKKDQSELTNIKKACEIAQYAYHTAIKSVKRGITELELKDLIEKLMMDKGAEGTSFDTIVAFGANAAVPHHVTGGAALEDNQCILIDMGCKVNGYCSDITRTAFFGTPSEKFTKCYDAVLRANLNAIENITCGTLAVDADAFARNSLKKDGLSEYFTHSLGHGVGLEIHEYPTLSPRKKDALSDGTVFTIEPGVYFDGEFGIRIEDTVVLSGGKVERLFTDNKELLIINS